MRRRCAYDKHLWKNVVKAENRRKKMKKDFNDVRVPPELRKKVITND